MSTASTVASQQSVPAVIYVCGSDVTPEKMEEMERLGEEIIAARKKLQAAKSNNLKAGLSYLIYNLLVCGADEFTLEEMEEMERLTDEIAAAREKLKAAKSYDLKVYFHVVSEDDALAGGNITDSAIRRQLDVLNETFYQLNVRWMLINVTRTIDADWFNNAAESTPQQTAMKKALHQGSAADLNV
ncbi:hypothetical protein H0H92_001809 [Tricholoma furcatifolium]|nr:hypothetical protein H0H92_001809 [Tricholoma furcatifolium]